MCQRQPSEHLPLSPPTLRPLPLHATPPPRLPQRRGDHVLTSSYPAIEENRSSSPFSHWDCSSTSSPQALHRVAFRRRGTASPNHQSHLLTINGVVLTQATLGKHQPASSSDLVPPISRHHRLEPRAAVPEPLSLGQGFIPRLRSRATPIPSHNSLVAANANPLPHRLDNIDPNTALPCSAQTHAPTAATVTP